VRGGCLSAPSHGSAPVCRRLSGDSVPQTDVHQ
jgi:hypothetical protein